MNRQQHGGRISGDQYCILISISVSLKEFEDNNQISNFDSKGGAN